MTNPQKQLQTENCKCRCMCHCKKQNHEQSYCDEFEHYDCEHCTPKSPKPAQLAEEKKFEISICKGVEGYAIYLNDYRIAGSKPWGGGSTIQEWKISKDDLFRAIPELAPIQSPLTQEDRELLDYYETFGLADFAGDDFTSIAIHVSKLMRAKSREADERVAAAKKLKMLDWVCPKRGKTNKRGKRHPGYCDCEPEISIKDQIAEAVRLERERAAQIVYEVFVDFSKIKPLSPFTAQMVKECERYILNPESPESNK